MIEAAIFDMDGLMFDTEAVWGRCWSRAFANLGFQQPPDQFIVDVRGTSGQRMWDVFKRYFGTKVPGERVYAEEYRLVSQENARHIAKKPGLDELLEWLCQHGIPMAVASSSPMESIRNNLQVAGVADYFDVIVCGADVRRSKPSPDIFLEAARRLGSSPVHTLVLEDSFNGVRAGHAGGFITVMVPDLAAPDDQMRQLADAICGSLGDVQQMLEEGQLGQG
ncbi:MAG: HAD family hydrolase [Atopobiaceae bacterium]